MEHQSEAFRIPPDEGVKRGRGDRQQAKPRTRPEVLFVQGEPRPKVIAEKRLPGFPRPVRLVDMSCGARNRLLHAQEGRELAFHGEMVSPFPRRIQAERAIESMDVRELPLAGEAVRVRGLVCRALPEKEESTPLSHRLLMPCARLVERSEEVGGGSLEGILPSGGSHRFPPIAAPAPSLLRQKFVVEQFPEEPVRPAQT
jgi:hypothetical protein